MKKIKLNSAKLILKKEIIGNLTNSEMMKIEGGASGQGGCLDYTTPAGGCNYAQTNLQGDCNPANVTKNCPPPSQSEKCGFTRNGAYICETDIGTLTSKDAFCPPL